MGELAFQQALARFLTDPTARERYLTSGGDAPPVVRDRLLALDRRRTSLFSHLLLINRLTKVVEALPYTTWGLGTDLWPVVQEYNRRCPPRQPKKYDEAMTFAGFLESTVDELEDGPPWLRDVLRYEECLLRLRFLPLRPPPQTADSPHLDEDAVRPRLSPAAAVLAFAYDLEELINAFDSGQPAPRLDPSPMLMLLQVTPNGEVRQDEVSLATAELLDLCTGERSLAKVIDLVADRFGLSDRTDTIRSGCVELCAELAARGVLILEREGF